MGEYDRNQQKPVSRAVANNGGGSRQLKEIVDNRNSIILPYNSHSSIQCCCIDVIQRDTPLESYLQGLEDIGNIPISDKMAMIGQDNIDKHNVIHDSLKRMVEQYLEANGELPFTLARMLNGGKWSGEKNKEFLDSLDRRTVQIATPYFLGYAYHLYDKTQEELDDYKSNFEEDNDRKALQRGWQEDMPAYTFQGTETKIEGGTCEEIAYLKYKCYDLEDDMLIPPEEEEEEDTLFMNFGQPFEPGVARSFAPKK